MMFGKIFLVTLAMFSFNYSVLGADAELTPTDEAKAHPEGLSKEQAKKETPEEKKQRLAKEKELKKMETPAEKALRLQKAQEQQEKAKQEAAEKRQKDLEKKKADQEAAKKAKEQESPEDKAQRKEAAAAKQKAIQDKAAQNKQTSQEEYDRIEAEKRKKLEDGVQANIWKFHVLFAELGVNRALEPVFFSRGKNIANNPHYKFHNMVWAPFVDESNRVRFCVEEGFQIFQIRSLYRNGASPGKNCSIQKSYFSGRVPKRGDSEKVCRPMQRSRTTKGNQQGSKRSLARCIASDFRQTCFVKIPTKS